MEGTDMDRRENRWRIDKSIPLPVIITLLLQTGGVIWWAATANERLNSVERQMAVSASQNVPDRMTRVEVQLQYAVTMLQDMQRDVRAISDRQDAERVGR